MQQNKLFVGNLPFRCNEGDLQVAFEQFGEIDEIHLILDRDTGRSRGFAFITFFESKAAEEALSMDGKKMHERPIRVNYATARSNKGRKSNKSDRQSEQRHFS